MPGLASPPASRLRLLPFAMLIGLTYCLSAQGDEQNADKVAFFRSKVEPILVKHCYGCHSTKAKELHGGLRLDSRQASRLGGDTGPAVVPEDPESSLLLKAIEYEELEMPPDGQLPKAVIADIRRWILAGAVDPREQAVEPEPDYSEDRKFWAFQPPKPQEPPAVRDGSWVSTPIDRFVLARLEAKGLAPSPPASRREWIRRVYFDLIGLPPTPEQLNAHLLDERMDADARLVDQLLASPGYGERWGQHWLDVVRYAETEGFEYDRTLPGAWRFRDYVITSFNEDKPYDRFLFEQLAGDEAENAAPSLRVASGFHRLGPVRRNAGNQKVASSRNEVLTERTDIIGSAFLGLTIGCARCHDHKFDPIAQRDYYRLQAFLASTVEDNVVIASEEEQRRWREATEQIDEQIAALKKELESLSPAEQEAPMAKIKSLEAERPAPLPTLCSVKNDAQQRTPIHLLRRGNPDLPGERLGMRPPGVLCEDSRMTLRPDTPNPRSKLADWLGDANHPLTSRVIANRIWQHHFGRGLVETANDFGKNGARPTHPELLDYLARELTDASVWRLKPLHRMIVLSNAYRQSSNAPRGHAGWQTDPDNRFLWRFSRRRLSAEELRDAMLSASGQLTNRAGGPSIMPPVDQQLIDQLYKPSQWQVAEDSAEHMRRSVYLVAKRNLRLPFMEVFDQPTAQTSCARREQSTHAPQALELLNGRLANELAAAFAGRLIRDVGNSAEAQVERAFLLVTSRPPNTREMEFSTRFIADNSLSEFALAMFNLNAFLYVD